ncbi:MAG: hypothetical protein RBT37_04425 [Dissulfurispiraceae bacterium]|jgi:hypothetical protein|nr:hypothetical protein [Dissulfurispiraceae bacterium]
MNKLDTFGLNKDSASAADDFFGIVLNHASAISIHSIHIVGSAATEEFSAARSDINSIIVLQKTSNEIIKFIAPLGRKYARKKMAAPFIIPLHELTSSVDTFPVEFLNYKLMHKTLFGEDIFNNIQIEKKHLRLQSERELRLLHINMTRQFISILGRTSGIPDIIKYAVRNSIPLLRAIIYLLEGMPPLNKQAVISDFTNASGLNSDIFETALHIKEGTIKPDKTELENIFFNYCTALENVCKMVNDLNV